MGRDFASDNSAGIHPDVLDAIIRANRDRVLAYGEDPYTARMEEAFRREFGPQVRAFPVFNGTAANVLSIRAMARSYHSVICSEHAHIEMHEGGAPEAIAGCKLVLIPAPQGKIRVRDIEPKMVGIGDQHHVQPRVISIAQSTELGTVYSPEEVRELAEFAHQNGMCLHMDGARIANAAASLGLSLKAATVDLGVDVLSFGGTKNGLMAGEAVVFFDEKLAEDFLYIRKQGMQLASKQRFLAVQLEALLSKDLWLRNARHANAMAKMLAEKVSGLKDVRIAHPVDANAVFAEIPRSAIPRLQEKYMFHVIEPSRGMVRWMTSFDTTDADVDGFVDAFRDSCAPG